MATIYDVARVAGVSSMTVSNVINAHPHVRQSTRDRVLRAIQELDFTVNVAARNLRTGRSGTIGLAVPSVDNPYFSRLIAEIVSAARERGYRVAVEQTSSARETELEAVSMSRNRLYDGLLLSTVGLSPADADLLRVDYPVVLLGEGIFGGPVDHIAMPNVDGSRAAVQHLLGRGCRKIAIFDMPLQEGAGVADLRLQGYREALDEAGIDFDDRYFIAMQDFTMECGAAAAKRVADLGLQADGVFCPTDAVAVGALRGFTDVGLRVPEDVRVIGFDDIHAGSFTVPRLSTVAPDHSITAATAVDFLLERIEGNAPESAREFITPFTLVARESTA
ncbi:LacI family DNA-binding transcriptional regulator [Arthrobacter sp. ISL-48]|uniref:LacI family DNA-binding transcriptional regulator n=1 Tax=Arthrobacter sp. ISL-48 TaxID=2819110 RepID=UPI001BE54813|nr:LacI family DNA-binding transcriptional regulator [Arthrobacter sp. ISL-48]MBT2532458.1 LacI family DNA-binding transcriptional regulator [Arthrobacter sp. ISL-48]